MGIAAYAYFEAALGENLLVLDRFVHGQELRKSK